MTGTRVSYLDEDQNMEGYLAAPDSGRNLPSVLVAPSWLNVNESICRRADRLAELGYTAFVADLFGAGVRPGPPQSPMTVAGPLLTVSVTVDGKIASAPANGLVASTSPRGSGLSRSTAGPISRPTFSSVSCA